jgi:TolB-like protein/DNA-binding CsgD family transcriptional regulator/Tfp pilus assembly protein PilF
MARPLTHRQLEVLEMVARGLTNPEIARVLGIGLGTVKKHVGAVIASLEVSNRTEAVGLLAQLEVGRRVAPAGDAGVRGFGERPVIALLPFEDLGASGDSEWFARGLLTDLTAAAGAHRWFPVIQADSVVALPGDADAGEQLGARYLVEGSVLREGETLTVTVRCREAESRANVWAHRYESGAGAIGALQHELVADLIDQLEPAVLRIIAMRAAQRQADAVAVWELRKRAEHRLALETRAAYQEAVRLFEEALALDRRSDAAWSGLALGHASAVYLGLVDDRRAAAGLASQAARRALELAPDAFSSHFSMGRALALSNEHAASLPELEEALERDPSSAIAAHTLAGALRREGAAEAAVPWYERALRLSPRGRDVYHVHGGYALAKLELGNYQAALDHATRAVRGNEADNSGQALDFYPIIPASLALLGRIDEAKAAWARAGEHVSRARMRHSARYAGSHLAVLAEGLRLAGWDGRLD